jgi:hypothetical protein
MSLAACAKAGAEKKFQPSLTQNSLAPTAVGQNVAGCAALSILIAFCLFYARKKLISSCVRCDGLAAGCFL